MSERHGLPLRLGEDVSSLLEELSSLRYNTRVIDILPNRFSLSGRYAACQHHKGGTTVCLVEYVVGMTALCHLLPTASIRAAKQACSPNVCIVEM